MLRHVRDADDREVTDSDLELEDAGLGAGVGNRGSNGVENIVINADL